MTVHVPLALVSVRALAESRMSAKPASAAMNTAKTPRNSSVPWRLRDLPYKARVIEFSVLWWPAVPSRPLRKGSSYLFLPALNPRVPAYPVGLSSDAAFVPGGWLVAGRYSPTGTGISLLASGLPRGVHSLSITEAVQ